MKYSYLYPSFQRKNLESLSQGREYDVWTSQEISNTVSEITEPIIEIGGPSPDGFYFLHDVKFNSRPVITNVSDNPAPYSDRHEMIAEQVEELVDATDMPYGDQSVGIFLMSAMSVSSDWWVHLPENEKDAASSKFNAEKEQAHFEMGKILTGFKSPANAEQSLRVKIYNEVNRCLAKNGLFFTDGHAEEVSILREMGYEVIACLQVNGEYGPIYEFVAQKTF